MNRWQVARQVQSLLRDATYADGTTKVFAENSVIVSLGTWADVFRDRQVPMAIVVPSSEEIDPTMNERSDLVTIAFQVLLIVSVTGDEWGEKALLGANRRANGQGKGLLEVEARVKTALLMLGPSSGLPIYFRDTGSGDPVKSDRNSYIASSVMRFTAKGTTFPTYEAPTGLAATGGSGQAALSWTLSPRFDAYRYVLRRASGSTPPATITDGSGVTLSSNLAVSKTDTGLAAGAYAYSLFLQYDDTDSNGATLETSSPQSVLVTVT